MMPMPPSSSHHQRYQRYLSACSQLPDRALLLDTNAMHSNINWALSHANGKRLRIATKSMRCVEVMRHIAATNPIFQGWMTYSLEEALWLRSLGFRDLLMGYPTCDHAALQALAHHPQEIVLMVDRIEHLQLLENMAAPTNAQFEICVDVDLSMDLPFVRFGIYRSAIQSEADLRNFLKHLSQFPHLKLVGMMGYEAQIAGLGDKHSALIRFLKRYSITQLRKRRAAASKMLQEFGHGEHLRIFNAGGTGSLTSSSQEECVNEMTVGSAFYAPTLFDSYRDFSLEPALFFSCPVVRHPTPSIYTLMGGGYAASGEAGPSRLPTPWLPEGLSLTKNEGAGEVQTPLRAARGTRLEIFDKVFLRPTKAGEFCEHFSHLHWLDGNTVTKTVNTYRGDEQSFL